MSLTQGLYSLGIHAYTLGVGVASRFGNEKARLWVEGRKEFPEKGQDDDAWVWFHAASLGEFEQGRPLIEAIKERYPNIKVSLSFFSPSGYEVRKQYPLADEVLYLPADTPKNARRWVERHRFVAAFFIKYEFWFHYMKALADAQVPLFYISLILNPDQYFFRGYGGWFREQLRHVKHFFAQDEATKDLLNGIGFNNVTVCGDTRFDRVAAIARQAKKFPEIEAFIRGRKCVIAGSTWPPDERLLAEVLPQLPDDYCLILAPHDISEAHIQEIRKRFADHQLYTELDCSKYSRILIINTIGILSQLYQYARFVYIGGGFGVNIHNIQEPVSFGCPVVFGPKHRSFKEAVDLVALGGAFSVNDSESLGKVFDRLIHDESHCAEASQICKRYVDSQLGATQTIMDQITSIFSA